MKEMTETVYIADDGSKFLCKEECEAYEKKLSSIKYFAVYHTPDLTETGGFMKCSVVAVYSEHGCHDAIVEKWCITEKHYSVLGPSVMGYVTVP